MSDSYKTVEQVIKDEKLDFWFLDTIVSSDVLAGLQAMACMNFCNHVFESLFTKEASGIEKKEAFKTHVANVYPYSILRAAADYSLICVYENTLRFIQHFKRLTGKDFPIKIYRLDDLKHHRNFNSHPNMPDGTWNKKSMNDFVSKQRQYLDFKPELLWGLRASILEEGAKHQYNPSIALDLQVTQGMFEMVKQIFQQSSRPGVSIFDDKTLLEMFSAFVARFREFTIKRYNEGKEFE
jgi:hypothetical protein